MTYRIDVNSGKYTFINNDGVVDILRNGLIWGSGNKAILALLQKVEKYEEALKYYAYDADSLTDDGSIARKAIKD